MARPLLSFWVRSYAFTCFPSPRLFRFFPPSPHPSPSLPLTIIIMLHRILSMMIGGEILGMAEPLLNRNFHPTVIVSGYCKALQKALEVCSQICRVIDVDNIKVRTSSMIANVFRACRYPYFVMIDSRIWSLTWRTLFHTFSLIFIVYHPMAIRTLRNWGR